MQLAAKLIVFARERSWSPKELLEEGAVWVQAYLFFLGYVLRTVDEVREQHRQRMEVVSGQQLQRP